EPGSDEWFVPGSRGAETHETVRPAEGEPVVLKHHPNSFLETSLAEQLAGLGAGRVAFCGMMTSMCVDATVRAAADRGLDAVLVGLERRERLLGRRRQGRLRRILLGGRPRRRLELETVLDAEHACSEQRRAGEIRVRQTGRSPVLEVPALDAAALDPDE